MADVVDGEVILPAHINDLRDGTAIESGAITADKIADEAWSTFTPTPLGFSGSPTVTTARYIEAGKKIDGYVDFSGTSNTTTVQFTLPAAVKNDTRIMVKVTDNSAEQTGPGYIDVAAGSATANVYKTLATGAWTAGGSKRIQGPFSYERN